MMMMLFICSCRNNNQLKTSAVVGNLNQRSISVGFAIVLSFFPNSPFGPDRSDEPTETDGVCVVLLVSPPTENGSLLEPASPCSYDDDAFYWFLQKITNTPLAPSAGLQPLAGKEAALKN